MRASYDRAEHLHHRLPGTVFDDPRQAADGEQLRARFGFLMEVAPPMPARRHARDVKAAMAEGKPTPVGYRRG